MKEGSSR